jgi:hypothetical protein
MHNKEAQEYFIATQLYVNLIQFIAANIYFAAGTSRNAYRKTYGML